MSRPEEMSTPAGQILDEYDASFLSLLQQERVRIGVFGEMIEGLNVNGQPIRVSRPTLDTEEVLASRHIMGRKYIIEVSTRPHEELTNVYDLLIVLTDSMSPRLFSSEWTDLGPRKMDEEFINLIRLGF